MVIKMEKRRSDLIEIRIQEKWAGKGAIKDSRKTSSSNLKYQYRNREFVKLKKKNTYPK